MKITNWLSVFSLLISMMVLFSSAAIAQFVPPPPAKIWGAAEAASSKDDSFTEADRKMLKQIYAFSRSIRAKLFPYQEEQNILELRN